MKLLRVEVNGIPLSVVERNPDAPRTVVMLHGYLDQGRSFDDLADALPKEWRSLSVDWRGHGESGRAGPGATYHLLDHVRDLDGLLGKMEVQRPVILGHSMGGNVAVLYAGSNARALGGLVLLESLGPPTEPVDHAPTRMRDVLQSRRAPKPQKLLPDLAAAEARLMATNPGLTPEGARRMAANALRPVDGGLTWKFDPAVQGPASYRYSEEALLAFLRGINVPSLLVRAEHGYVPARADTPERYAAVGQLEVVELAGAWHHVHVDRVEEVAGAVCGFLAALS